MAVTQTKEEIIAMLQAGNVTFDYTKLDGATRNIVGTLQEGVIPAIDPSRDANSTRKTKAENIVLWDIEESAWRTVKLERINSISS